MLILLYQKKVLVSSEDEDFLLKIYLGRHTTCQLNYNMALAILPIAQQTAVAGARTLVRLADISNIVFGVSKPYAIPTKPNRAIKIDKPSAIANI